MRRTKIYWDFIIAACFRGDRTSEGEVLRPYSKAKGINAMMAVEEHLFVI